MIPVTLGIPVEGTLCLCYGMAYGTYGYTPDEMCFMRCIVVLTNGELELRVDECTSRYDTGFTPTHWSPYEVASGMEEEAKRILDGNKE